MQRTDSGSDITVLDGLALVMGSSIASVHILRIMRSGLSAAGWVMVCVTFTWVALTSSGPFIFLARRFSRRLAGYPKVGDWLWAVMGIPWLLTAIIQSAMPGEDPRQNPLFSMTLSVSLVVACTICLAVVWGTWVMVPPEQAALVEAAPWTNRVGLILSVAWPIQCGLGMVVLS
ncbi:MAG: hypothetical protein ACP5XB_14175 [Isosphaeraceae bacterium]